ncbi:UNKNOWN [Stylonychia lemnae]|uniref:Uncharacterized protein n=1 Tax=Stylonychia lemnae TaxID=5949 RepID=A0A078A396_STYLE|nr:UNKNOWN [Stylonychia lemnae]|eukprot:CDW76748.1 UNKNOWN [Stylonychia lemnae]
MGWSLNGIALFQILLKKYELTENKVKIDPSVWNQFNTAHGLNIQDFSKENENSSYNFNYSYNDDDLYSPIKDSQKDDQKLSGLGNNSNQYLKKQNTFDSNSFSLKYGQTKIDKQSIHSSASKNYGNGFSELPSRYDKNLDKGLIANLNSQTLKDTTNLFNSSTSQFNESVTSQLELQRERVQDMYYDIDAVAYDADYLKKFQ